MRLATRLLPSVLLSVFALASAAFAQDLAVRGRIVHTMGGARIEDGVVLVRGGKIAAVGRASEVALPAGVQVLEAAVVTPGLIDAHSSLGLAGWLNYAHDKDELERSSALQPELRAIDAYNAREPLIEWVRGFGVTTVHTGHAPGAVISGQTMIVKLRGETLDEAVLQPLAMVAATLGEGATSEDDKAQPGTRAKAAALLREELVKTQSWMAKRARAVEEKEPLERDLRRETLALVLEGKVPLLVTAQRAQDIATALRLAKEFDFHLVLDGAAEAPLVLDAIRAAQVPVIVHPTMFRAVGETENLSLETPGALKKAGIQVALQGGYESYVPRARVVLFEAAEAAAYGLSFDDALGLITLDAARLLGIEQRVGSLEVGKDGDLALYDGDPFEYTTHCVGVVIDGRVVSSEKR
ncbi:MAG: amidohydrolase [Planctomycetes bacterium]|nr:amidohydrolase [Planctomycetota bacterium]